MNRILCLWLPNWPIQRRLVAQPELKNKAVVLHQLQPRSGQQITACSRAARDGGLYVGMSLAEASGLWKKTSQQVPLHLEEHDPPADRQQLAQLARWSEPFSPLIGLETCVEPQSLLLDITGLDRLLGSDEKIANQLQAAFHRLGYRPLLAVAPTLGAAWGISHHRSVWGKPQLTSTEQVWDTLGPLPPAALRLSYENVRLLDELGIGQIQQLRRLPRAALTSRFGPDPALRIDQAAGTVQEVVVAEHAPPEYFAARSLEHPLNSRPAIAQLLEDLLRQVAQQLAQQDRGAVQIECCLSGSQGQQACLPLGLHRPTASIDYLMELLAAGLDRFVAPREIVGAVVQVTATAPWQSQQRELFPDPSRSGERYLAPLIDRLAGRLGAKAIVGVQTVAEAQPEQAFRDRSLVGEKSRRKSRARPLRHGPLQRPLHLIHPPVRLEVMAIAPDGPPLAFAYQGTRHHVARHWGPERVESGWWRQRSARRDYYRVETKQGYRFWLFRELRGEGWFLHGEFD
jgi:protein ImuB